jgi:hypothetical protein
LLRFKSSSIPIDCEPPARPRDPAPRGSRRIGALARKLGSEPTTAKVAALACAGITGFFIMENVQANAAANWILVAIESVSTACLLFVAARLPGPGMG